LMLLWAGDSKSKEATSAKSSSCDGGIRCSCGISNNSISSSTLAHASACSLHFGSPGNPQYGCSVDNPKSNFVDAEHFHR
jgi:hypothetical protein